VASSSASSEAETAAAGAALAPRLRAGAVVHVDGPLGAGKTVFVRGAARALGVDDPVTSPTFTVANLYAGSQGPVAHLDLYRSERLADEDWADLEPYFDRVRAVFVEWPAAGAGVLPPADVVVRIAIVGEDARRIEVEERATGA
jgi:tRNA threonylcarbamoyladenosine biosynthesis protein TsaE